jgi:hypothetical protein
MRRHSQPQIFHQDQMSQILSRSVPSFNLIVEAYEFSPIACSVRSQTNSRRSDNQIERVVKTISFKCVMHRRVRGQNMREWRMWLPLGSHYGPYPFSCHQERTLTRRVHRPTAHPGQPPNQKPRKITIFKNQLRPNQLINFVNSTLNLFLFTASLIRQYASKKESSG